MLKCDVWVQLWVFCNREKRCVVLAWRGTEQLKWKDLLTDVRLTPTAFNVERVWGGGRSDASDEVSKVSLYLYRVRAFVCV